MFLKIIVVFAGALLVWVSAQASAPTCRTVFFKDDLLIHDLAHLRLELDMAKIQGSDLSASVISMLSKQYDQAFSYFIQNKIYTEPELKGLIRQELLRRQDQQNQKIEADKIARDEERRIADIYLPQSLGTEFPSVALTGAKLSFLDQQHALAFLEMGELKIYRFDHKPTDSFPKVAAFDFDRTSRKILYLTKNYELHEYDVSERQDRFIAKVPAGLNQERLQMELSPSGEKFALYLGDRVQIFETKTGKYLASTDVSYGTTLGLTIRKLRFHNDDQIIFDGGPRLFKFTVSSNTREILKTLISTINQWELSANREHLAIESRRDLDILQLVGSMQASGSINYFANDNSSRNFSFVQGSDKPLVFFRYSNRLGIYDLRSFDKPVFNFADSYSSNPFGRRNLRNMTVSENGKKAVVIFQDNDSQEVWAEFWNLPFNQ